MKKIILILCLCLSAAGPSFAQNNIEAMKFLTVTALMQYGQKLYYRGDYDEAGAVFNHVLTYDSHQALALRYLKNMGYLPTTHSPAPLKKINVEDTESLKEAIVAQKQRVEQLKAQLIQ